MVKLQAIILGAFLACNINSERILQSGSSCKSCKVGCSTSLPAPCDDVLPACQAPDLPPACDPQILDNNVVQGASNFVLGDANGVFGDLNNVQGFKNEISTRYREI